MSNHTNRDLYNLPRYVHQHVGGDKRPIDNQGYIGEQINLIKNRGHLRQVNTHKGLPPLILNKDDLQDDTYGFDTYASDGTGQSFSPGLQFSRGPINKNVLGSSSGGGRKSKVKKFLAKDRYDPYLGFLTERGLLDDEDNNRRFQTIYLNIDSRFRTKKPTNIAEEPALLGDDPLFFSPESNIITINHPGHNFERNDLIVLDGAIGDRAIIRTIVAGNDNLIFRPDTAATDPTPAIPVGNQFVKIIYEHNIPLTYTGDVIMVEIEGIRGNRGNIDTISYLNNIPLNIVNSVHPVRLIVNSGDLNQSGPFADAFFIEMPIALDNDPFNLDEYNFRIKFLDIFGIPLSEINADYPIDPDHRQGFHKIINITEDTYDIQVPTLAIPGNAADFFPAGGNCIYISKIISQVSAYPDPACYNIQLGQVFHNIVSIRLVSSEIPNSEFAIRDTPGRANNKFYWNDIDDGDYLYCIEVPPGNYTPNQLATVMQNLFFETDRVNFDALIITPPDEPPIYNKNHFIRVELDASTNLAKFSSFKESILVRPIVATDPDISLLTDPQAQGSFLYELTINHPSHGMTEEGQTILIANAINHYSIPSTAINGEHVVTSIIDTDNYTIEISGFNLTAGVGTDTGGGLAVYVYVPDLFRIRFDESDTLGAVLGFRNPGDPNSVTPFNSVITNNDPYAFDIEKDAVGEPIIINNNALQLSGDNYIFMVFDQIDTLESIGPIKNAFAKIQLCDIPGNVLFNSYVSTIRTFEDPFDELAELDVKFYTPEGFLYDFNGLDHSYTLEIITVNETPGNTHISVNSGKNYNLKV